MSDERKLGNEAREPEIVADDQPPQPGSIRRTESTAAAPASLGTVVSEMFHSPKRDARKAREWADAARAESELDEALTNLGTSRAKLRNVGKLIARDEEQRDIDLMRLKNQRDEEARIAKHKALQDELAEEEIRAKIAEARRRREQAENPARPPDEDSRRREAIARKFRERMGRRFTEQEVRAYTAQVVAEIKERAGGKITPAIQREIDNVADVMNSLLDEL